ncbi:hypothetical protein CEXT_758881 [Caerostris extrusa]|uniref:Uncharacterized protein n=1 Tax=Caerostris extrusa TaxID=172846 RepID=A0AAV4X4S5_CAEEX|nr:hypothetical protein CEXT_758881 [Caerostris extrusa]
MPTVLLCPGKLPSVLELWALPWRRRRPELKAIPDIAGKKKQEKWNCKKIFQFQLTPSGKEIEREKKKVRKFRLGISCCRTLPSAVFSSVKFEECHHFYYARNNSQFWSFGRCHADAENSRLSINAARKNSGRALDKSPKKSEIQPRYFLLSHSPSTIFSSVKSEECRQFYYALE